MSNEQALRQSFEACLRKKGLTDPYFERNEFGYLNGVVAATWEGFLMHEALALLTAAPVDERDKVDAERYRWLADSNNYYEAIELISDGSLTEDALGKAIDAEIARGKGVV